MSDMIVVALIGLIGTLVLAGVSAWGTWISNKRLGKPNGQGDISQMLEKILHVQTDHGRRLTLLERHQRRQAPQKKASPKKESPS